MRVPVKVHPHNTALLNTGMAVVDLLSDAASIYSGINACSNIMGGLPRDMCFGVPAKDADVVVYGCQDWAVLNDHDKYFGTVEDYLNYMFGDVVMLTQDTSGAASSQPDNDQVYRVYSCDGGRVNIIYYQDCYSIDKVVGKFDNTINAFWVEQVGTAFISLHYAYAEITAINNPEAYQTPERNSMVRVKVAQFGLQYREPAWTCGRATSMAPAMAAPYGQHPALNTTDGQIPSKG